MAEAEMWQAVIEQAVNDAYGRGLESSSQLTLKDKREAQTWLLRGGEQFRHVCHLAGMDPDFVREAFRDGKLRGYRKHYGGSKTR